MLPHDWVLPPPNSLKNNRLFGSLFRFFGFRNFRTSGSGFRQEIIDPPAIDGADRPAFADRDSPLLRQGMGRAYFDLHPDIRARFAQDGHETPLRYVGEMTTVERSLLGACLAWLTRFASLLPTQRANHVPFEFDIRPYGLSWLKRRCYHFADRDFQFVSVMRLNADGHFVERFRGGLGMNLALSAHADALIFEDRGYFLHWRNWQLSLPDWLGPGRFRLIHRNIDRLHFSVTIELRHRLFGGLIRQFGTFRREGGAGIHQDDST